MKNPQHDEATAGKAILKHVRCIQYLQDELTELLTPGEGSAEVRMLRKQLRLGNDFASDDLRDIRMVLVEKRGEAIEVGERVSRPFHLHRSRQGRKAGVPQV